MFTNFTEGFLGSSRWQEAVGCCCGCEGEELPWEVLSTRFLKSPRDSIALRPPRICAGGVRAVPCLWLLMPALIPLSHRSFRSYTMVKRWQVERMALCFLSSSHKQTGEKLELSLSFPRGSVNNYHCTDRREETLDEIFEGSWSELFTHFPLLPAMSALSRATLLGFSLPMLEPLPLQSSSCGSVAFLLCSLSLGSRDGSPTRLSHAPFPLQQHCWEGKALPVLEVAVTSRSWQSTGCAGAAERAPPAELFPGLQGFPASGGIFCCGAALQGERALPWGLRHLGLVGVPAHSRGIGIAIFKVLPNALLRCSKGMGNSREKAASSSELETQAPSLPQCRSFLPLTWRAPSARTAPLCFGAFAARAKQELQRVQQNFNSPTTHKASGNMCFPSG